MHEKRGRTSWREMPWTAISPRETAVSVAASTPGATRTVAAPTTISMTEAPPPSFAATGAARLGKASSTTTGTKAAPSPNGSSFAASRFVRRRASRRLASLLGLARRAGQAVAGRDKVLEGLRAGRVGLLMQAVDGSPAERARLTGGRTDVRVVTPLTAGDMGGVFGREHAVHVAVAPGRLAEALVAESGRLAGLRGAAGPPGLRQTG